MTIQKLDDFAENGDKNLTGIDIQQGFVQSEKPARQWFNYIFNSIIKKVNEVIDGVDLANQTITDITIDTDKIVDGAVTADKLSDASITGDKIAKDTELNTPKLSATYPITTADAPNLVLASDGTLKTSTRKAGVSEGDLVVRGANGYPTNNNAIGVGQNWQDVTASRSIETNYTNTTGRPIVVKYIFSSSTGITVDLVVSGLVASSSTKVGSSSGGATTKEVGAIVPAGAVYRISNGVSSYSWMELR